MTKTMRDLLLEGGVKGKRFIDKKYLAPKVLIYEVNDIEGPNGDGKPFATIHGEVISPEGAESSYTMDLINCLTKKKSPSF
ncbi:MAG: hypothetical protein AABW47_04200 [Nanoarchaeota archaeon]